MSQYAKYSPGGGGGSGTVTSVGLSLPASVFTVSGSPVTASGTLSASFSNQSANTVFAGPTSGGPATPAFRALVAADIPSLSATYVTQSEVGAANGVASLDGAGKVPVGQLPSAVMEYQGAWDPSTNTPSLSDGTGTNGNVYYVTALFAGPIAGLTDPSMVNFQIGDLVIYSSAIGKWQLVTPAAGVSSVNGLQGAVVLTQGNLTDAGTDGITITGGTNAVWGSGTSISQHVADATHNGYLLAADWSTFNNKQSTLTLGNLTDAGTDGITITGGTGAVVGSGTSISQHVADTTHNGYLSSTDWNTFNGKQAAGSYITALTGDVTATGPGSVAATLATVNGNVGSFGSSTAIPNFTVNAKGLITAAGTSVVIAPAGTLSGATLAAGVTASSLTSLGTQAVALNMGSHQINNVTDPTSAQDAATKNYVDTHGATSLGTTTSTSSIIGGVAYTTFTVTNTNRTIDTTTNDNQILVSTTTTPSTITLPAPSNGRTITIKDIGGNAQTNNITVAQHSTEKINGVAASLIMTFNYGFITLTSNGTDWFVIAQSSTIGLWTAYTPSLPAGWGTTTNQTFFYRRQGDSLQVRGSWVNGTVSASSAYIPLPTGLTIDSTKISTFLAYEMIGIFQASAVNGGAPLNTFDNGLSDTLTLDTSNLDRVLVTYAGTTGNGYSTANVTAVSGTNDSNALNFEVPISGWGIY